MRGRVVLRAGERDIELRLSTNALCRIEEVSGKAIGALIAGLSGAEIRLSDLRFLVMGAAGVSLDEAGDLIDEAGLQAAVEAIGKAIEAAFPTAEPDAKKKAAAA